MDKFSSTFGLAGRVLIASLFVISGLGKLGAIGAIQGYMDSVGVPGILVYPTILFEVVGGLAIIVGYQTRIVALALAGFCVATALVFHNNLGDQMEFVLFLKNLAIAGGFLFLARDGAGQFSLDSRRATAAS